MNQLIKMTIQLKLLFSLCILFISITAHAQGTLLLFSKSSCEVVIDGEIHETLQANTPKKIELSEGEHLIQGKIHQNQTTEIVTIETGKQKITELSFTPIEEPIHLAKDPDETAAKNTVIQVANLDLSLAGAANHAIEKSEDYSNHSDLYYAFAEGDEISIEASVKNKKGKFYIFIYSYPSQNLIYSKQKQRNLIEEEIKIKSQGIYIIRIGTSAVFDKKLKLNIGRKPASTNTTDFNTTVVKRFKYNTQEIENSFHFINSTSNETWKGGNDEIVIPIKIPPNTVEWYYAFSASRNENEVKNNINNLGLLGEINNALNGINPMTMAINFGVEMFTTPPGADYANVYLLDFANYSLFKSEGKFRYIVDGSRQNLKSSTIKVNCCTDNQSYYLGVQNRSIFHGIHIGIKAVAITKEDYWDYE